MRLPFIAFLPMVGLSLLFVGSDFAGRLIGDSSPRFLSVFLSGLRYSNLALVAFTPIGTGDAFRRPWDVAGRA
jgi:hypothetical protein